jgi:mannose-6-phosphate isomerase-like protein (cupin superfamily)
MFIIEERPWGSFTILEDTATHKVKRIVVKPKQRLSKQLHHKRSEVWTVISGNAMVTIGEQDLEIGPGGVVRIPVETTHRVYNLSDTRDLVFIEVQTGTYFGEDDIVRFSDDYGRVHGSNSTNS